MSNFVCDVCRNQYSSKKSLNKHTRIHHPACTDQRTNSILINCPFCYVSLSTFKQFISHSRDNHFDQVTINTISYNFNSMTELTDWKNSVELESGVRYVQHCGKVKLKECIRIIYLCNRSGEFKSRGLGLRKMRQQGSSRVGSFCPARIMVDQFPDGRIQANYYSEHFGHGKQMEFVQLTAKDREMIAGLIEKNHSFDTVLQNIKELVRDNPSFERLKLIKRKDLHNIARSFSLMLRKNAEKPSSRLKNESSQYVSNTENNNDGSRYFKVEGANDLASKELLKDSQAQTEPTVLEPNIDENGEMVYLVEDECSRLLETVQDLDWARVCLPEGWSRLQLSSGGQVYALIQLSCHRPPVPTLFKQVYIENGTRLAVGIVWGRVVKQWIFRNSIELEDSIKELNLSEVCSGVIMRSSLGDQFNLDSGGSWRHVDCKMLLEVEDKWQSCCVCRSAVNTNFRVVMSTNGCKTNTCSSDPPLRRVQSVTEGEIVGTKVIVGGFGYIETLYRIRKFKSCPELYAEKKSKKIEYPCFLPPYHNFKPEVVTWKYANALITHVIQKVPSYQPIRDLIKHLLPKETSEKHSKLIQELIIEVVKWCKSHSMSDSKLSSVIGLYLLTHLYFTGSLWRTTYETYNFFKRSLILHCIHNPSQSIFLFNSSEAKLILLHFVDFYLPALPLIRVLVLPMYRLNIQWQPVQTQSSTKEKDPHKTVNIKKKK